jgi:hypothetical protein
VAVPRSRLRPGGLAGVAKLEAGSPCGGASKAEESGVGPEKAHQTRLRRWGAYRPHVDPLRSEASISIASAVMWLGRGKPVRNSPLGGDPTLSRAVHFACDPGFYSMALSYEDRDKYEGDVHLVCPGWIEPGLPCRCRCHGEEGGRNYGSSPGPSPEARLELTDELARVAYYGRFDDSGHLVELFRATFEGDLVVKAELLCPEGWMSYPDQLPDLDITEAVTSADEVSPDQALSHMAKMGKNSVGIAPGADGNPAHSRLALFEGGDAPDIPPACPRCGWARVVPILWGYPDPADGELEKRGEVALGGCLLSERPERWLCQICGLRGGESLLGET